MAYVSETGDGRREKNNHSFKTWQVNIKQKNKANVLLCFRGNNRTIEKASAKSFEKISLCIWSGFNEIQ